MRGAPVFIGFQRMSLFAVRYHHTERGKRCKAEKCVKRPFFDGFFNFSDLRVYVPELGRFHASQLLMYIAASRLVVHAI